MGKNYLFFSFLITMQLSTAAQTEQPVRFTAGNFITGNTISKGIFNKAQLQAGLFNDNYYVLVQFSQLPDAAMQAQLVSAGVQLVEYLPGNAYLAVIKNSFDFTLANRYRMVSVNVVPPMYKSTIQPGDFNDGINKQSKKLLAVTVFGIIDKAAIIKELEHSGAVIVHEKLSSNSLFFLEPDAGITDAVARLPFVSSVNLQQVKDRALNYNSKGLHSVSALLNTKGLSGKGVAVGIGDDADVSTHIDFTGRLINRAPVYPMDHGTHVAGTTAGGGLLNPLYKGNAPKATIVNQFFSDIITNTPTYINDYNMVLTNNSYYTGEDSCPGNSKYDVSSNYVDAQTRSYSQLLHVVAAGNDGSYNCSGYPASFATIKSGWQCGKNVLTVGAMKSDDYNITFFSSRGPVQDGRLKPEVVANGWAVSSTYTNNNYAWYFGTSMAGPNVMGSLALVYERYRQLNSGANPSGELVKAVACNTAEDLGNTGPDFTYGFGMINARRAVEVIEQNRYITGIVSNGASNNHIINIPAGAVRVKVMLYWVDKEAAANAASTLVNDLDLRVTTPLSVVHNPLVLNATPGGVNLTAVEGVDHRNNIEQVVIENPGSGNFTITVNGFAVPFGPQQYVLTYEIVNPSVTVEYPFGGEAWVPAAAETIRWSAYGNESETFSVEYSDDNGNNWTTLSSAVPASARSFVWSTGPATPTNTAMVRVKRNNTALSGQGASFTVLGQPQISTTNVCEGAVQLSWSAISTATSYDVLQLIGDSMQVIGNTASLSYVVKGLDKDTRYWLAVRAKNGSFAGRRSVAIDVVPNSGACTLPDFDNDVAGTVILEPNTGREFSTAGGNPGSPIKVQFKNLDNAAISGPMNVAYSINGDPAVTESISPSVAAGATFVHTFAQHPLPISGPLTLNIKVWITRASDNNHLNDTVYKKVKRLENQPIFGMPVIDDFETTGTTEYRNNVLGFDGAERFDFATSSLRGRVRSFVNTGFARSGTNALTLDQAPISSQYNADSLTATYNLLVYGSGSAQLRYDFYYKNHGQENRPGNKVWMRGSENDSWIAAYDLFANQAAISQWKFASINVNEVLATGFQFPSTTFQVRFGQEGLTSANSVVQEFDYDDGYTFDDTRLTDAFNDVSLLSIVSPDKKGCGLGSATPVTIAVKNYTNTVLNNIAVSYRINGGTIVTENIPVINGNQTLNYTFSATANLSAYIDYNCDFWINYGPDTYRGNDSVMNYNFRNTPLISNFPYLEGFEANNGNWYVKGSNASWQWGTPAKTIINKAANGSKAWVTSLVGRYRENELSYLYSPCFDLSSMAQPVLSFSHIFRIEDDCPCDYTWVEYSADGGSTWQKLGTPGTGTNWYDDAGTVRWQASQPNWHVASIDLPPGLSSARFRFVMAADGGVNFEGVGIDDIHVFDKKLIYTGAPVTSGLSQTVNINGWVHFNDAGGKRIVSVNSFGQNLGLTNVQVYPYTGQVRDTANQYYANRNIVIQPAVPPAGNVNIRFYFTDAEAKALINATGCTTCIKPTDPYELGVTKYNGLLSEENGTLSDNTAGAYTFINPASVDIIPYDNGYYAEYAVSSFSEFWLSKTAIVPGATICPGDTIVYTAALGGSTYQWQEDIGSGFANITNGANYIGATTSTLKLVSLPTSSTGNRYRCVLNGVPGNPFTLRFTRLWNGSVNTDWFNIANWGCGQLPDQYTDVVLPAGLSNYPVLNSNAVIRSLKTNTASTVTVAPGSNLQIKGQ
jgi:Subtilase family